MYRIGFIIVTALAIAFGLLTGTLNSDTVSVDLLWVQLEWPLGLLILSVLATGLLIGLLLAWFFSILPLRAQLRRLRNEAARNPSGSL